MEQDILAIRLRAHLVYLYENIGDLQKRKDFLNTMNILISGGFPSTKSKSGGTEMAIDLFNEVYYIHLCRFEKGRFNHDFFLERL